MYTPVYSTITTACVIFLYISYVVPTALGFFAYGRRWTEMGPWQLGRFYRPLAVVCVLGCGLLIAGFIIIYVHNALLIFFGVEIQGQEIARLFAELESPVWFFIVGAIVAPLVEEIFFRGFLFQGFRQKYGWVSAMLLSSAIFAAGHLDPASLLPTFILGLVLAYLYQRSNSLWPGIILHFLVNGFSLCAVLIYTRLPPEYLSKLWLIG